MALARETIIEQIDSLLQEYERAEAASPHDDLSGGLPNHELKAIRTRMRAAIERLAPAGSSYATAADDATGWDGDVVAELTGILRALRADVEAGYTQSVAELLHGEVFEDFLEMGQELHSKGFHAPAAVLAGSVLEEHVRKLAAKAGLETAANGKPKGFDALGIELVKAEVITEPERKILVGAYAQRTEAAHGRLDNVVAEEVGRMPDVVREFMVRHPA